MKQAACNTFSASTAPRLGDLGRVAVIIPCLNEGANIGKVVSDFLHYLPGAKVFVYDNGSSDGTAEEAAAHGAFVRREAQRGKGHAVRRMFRDVEADIYLIVDGDNTYDAASTPAMVERLLQERLDMVMGRRVAASTTSYRYGHRMGNRLLTHFVGRLFGRELKDMLTGYRAMSRRFVKSFPVGTRGFEIETEMTIHLLQVEAPFAEVDTSYFGRDEGSQSKLRTLPDGLRVLRTMLELLALERPISVFGGIGALCLFVATAAFLPILRDFLETGMVPRFPTLIAGTAFMVSGMMSIFAGVILYGVARVRRDIKRLAYLRYPAPEAWPEDETKN